ncbi:HAD superfamily hydrolase (TIGR01509 family) [Mycolicibacterium sp. BK556]|uniref:HAD family hydrolase n=1 Tax=unclassified Mycolicibacterium TaxID=2636767 RepID=UPI0018402C7A|nr:HAD superfamily hydrolase (TIGR01509 family) [Mycolicibacterium sp. BK556]MBB3632016.1 HAD superfamily hydrolase (TIGR01509 family) [Mycolicibacterium sp. BK607]
MPEPMLAREVMSDWARGPRPAVIFDFNGTLSDDEPILFRIFSELFDEHLGWSMTQHDYDSQLLGHSDREIVEKALAITGVDHDVDALLELRKGRYRDLVADHNPIQPATVRLVQLLAERGVPMAIVTGAQRDDVRAVLESSPVGELIRVVVAEEDVTRGKPDPEGFLSGAAQIGCAPSDIVIFEDSVPGIRGALAAGMRCIAVGAGPSPESTVAVIPRLSADVVEHVLPLLGA